MLLAIKEHYGLRLKKGRRSGLLARVAEGLKHEHPHPILLKDLQALMLIWHGTLAKSTETIGPIVDGRA